MRGIRSLVRQGRCDRRLVIRRVQRQNGRDGGKSFVNKVNLIIRGRRSPRKLEEERPGEIFRLGNFIQTEHAVNGEVFIQDRETFIIRDFNYDGRGPSTVFFGGEDGSLDSGKIIQYPFKKFVGAFGPAKLKGTKRKDIKVKLPKDLDACSMRWLSVWCDLFEISFGHVDIDKNYTSSLGICQN